MKRPAIKDKAVSAYVDYLEEQISGFKTDTKKKFYLGVQRQLDILSDELLAEEFRLSLRSDSEVDRFLKILKESTQIVDAMDKFEKKALPVNEDKNIAKGTADEFINS